MSAVDDHKAELIKAARIFARYLQLSRVRLKKQLNLTETAVLDAVQGLDKAEREAAPEMADVLDARDDLETRRAINESQGQECCLVVVGYATGRDPFRLLGRISVDTGEERMPNPPITDSEMQSVAYAAKMAFYKILKARKKAAKPPAKKRKPKAWTGEVAVVSSPSEKGGGWFEGWSKVIKNQGKEQRGEEEDDPATKTCQQCRESYLEAASSAETFRRFCSRTCEDQYDKELKGEDDKDSETEEA
jgi:hypothetical protein